MIKILRKDKAHGEGWSDLDYVAIDGDAIYGVNMQGERVWINWRVEDVLNWALKGDKELLFIDEDGRIY